MQFKLLRLFLNLGVLLVICATARTSTAQMMMDGMSTEAKRPITAQSNESSKSQLAHARAEGDAVDKCTNWILSNNPGASGQMNAGEYKITYAVTKPEGWYEFADNAVNWREPSNATADLLVWVQDGADGRIVPPLDIKAKIVGAGSALIENKTIPFAWMPLVNGYGDAINLPTDGSYKVVIDIAPPDYRRHDPYNGDRFTKPVHAEFPAVSVNLKQLAAEKSFGAAMEERKDLAKAAGAAYGDTLQAMYQQANDGKDTTDGDYFVAYAIEYSEGYWFYDDDDFRYKSENEQSAKTNAHFESLARDLQTGRFLPDLNTTITVAKGDRQIGTFKQMFMWHPWLYHYGENWRVPKGDDDYRLHIHMDAPAYRRFGKTDGRQFTAPIDVDFKGVKVKTGER